MNAFAASTGNRSRDRKEIEVGETYHGKVVSIKEFGAFVEVFPGKDGLVHISELADFRVKRTEDVAKVGEMIWVKCIGIDDKGRVKLSRKAALKEQAEGDSPDGAGGEGHRHERAEQQPVQ